jgi:two-component system, OmpR family, sensor kinase
MHTPPLRRRVALSGLTVFTLLLVALGTFVVLSLRSSLEQTLDELLADRAELVQQLHRTDGTEELARHLAAAGIPAVVTDADGDVLGQAEPATSSFGQGPPAAFLDVPDPRVSRLVTLPDGAEVEVFATRAGVDATLRRVVTLLTMGAIGAVGLAAALLHRVTGTALAPLTAMVSSTRRTAEGRRGERLRPDDPTTELGRLAVAHDEMLDALEAAVERAEDAEERTRRFLDDAAHQLRTPVAGIRATVESLLSLTDADPEVHDRLMANLVRETSRASRLLRDLLTMARLDTGRPPARTETDLEALCREEVERTRSLAPHLEVGCQPASESLPALVVDRAGVQEVVANLLDNARRHAGTTIELRLSRDGSVVHLEVRDDGPGVTPGAEELVFERFATLDGKGGSGLGLAIARSIAEAHSGGLAYRDGRFVLTLPIEDVPAPAVS